jgi:hypothetical protein
MTTRVVISLVTLVNDAGVLLSMDKGDASVVMGFSVEDEIINSVDVLKESGSVVDDDVKEEFCVLAITISVSFVLSTGLVTLELPAVESNYCQKIQCYLVEYHES